MKTHATTQKSNFISESELKNLAKFVLKEIAINPDSEGPKHPIEQLFTNIQNHMQNQEENNPLTKDTASGKIAAKNLIVQLRKTIRAMISAHFNKSKEDYTKAAGAFNYYRDQFIYLAVMWARKIDNTDDDEEKLRPEIHEVMTQLRTHADGIASQLVNLIKFDLKKYKNYINAINNVRYIHELLDAMEKDFTELLTLAEKGKQ